MDEDENTDGYKTKLSNELRIIRHDIENTLLDEQAESVVEARKKLPPLIKEAQECIDNDELSKACYLFYRIGIAYSAFDSSNLKSIIAANNLQIELSKYKVKEVRGKVEKAEEKAKRSDTNTATGIDRINIFKEIVKKDACQEAEKLWQEDTEQELDNYIKMARKVRKLLVLQNKKLEKVWESKAAALIPSHLNEAYFDSYNKALDVGDTALKQWFQEKNIAPDYVKKRGRRKKKK